MPLQSFIKQPKMTTKSDAGSLLVNLLVLWAITKKKSYAHNDDYGKDHLGHNKQIIPKCSYSLSTTNLGMVAPKTV